MCAIPGIYSRYKDMKDDEGDDEINVNGSRVCARSSLAVRRRTQQLQPLQQPEG